MANEDASRPRPTHSLLASLKRTEVNELSGYGTRQDERSLAVAERMSTIVGHRPPVVERYLGALSKVPFHHLLLLERRGTRIVFAPNIAQGMASELAEHRRGRPLREAELWHLATHRSQASGTIAVYDPALDLIVFPTSYASADFDRVAHHEVGHALTMRDADPRPSLLEGLPRRMAAPLREGREGIADDDETLWQEVVEALADGYASIVAGQPERVPSALRREINLIIETVMDNDRLRFRFDQDV